MEIKAKAMGEYATNCYIITNNGCDFVIDPGVGATSWVLQNVKNPVAILNTHGHFDHVWSNAQISQKLNIPIYCPKDDCFMLQNDPFSQGTPSSTANIEVEPNQEFILNDTKIKFHHFPGHTPGCSAIEINGKLFSGDFIFDGSIGRCDFPYSNPQDMKKSLKQVLTWQNDIEIFPGHGNSTTLNKQRDILRQWINVI